MIEFRSGNIFASRARCLVNPVNCVGVMGAGLAKAFAERFPNIVPRYQALCRAGFMKPGLVFFIDLGEQRIALFPTKRHWRSRSRIEDIAAGLDNLAAQLRVRSISSVAVPALGCGLGGLRWTDVRPLMLRKLDGIDGCSVTIYEPKP